MKGVIFSAVIIILTFLGMGCNTVPRHLAQEEVIIIYPPVYPILDPQPIVGPNPPPPPTRPVTRPPINSGPSRDGSPPNSNNGGSYGKRDPIKSDGNSGRIDTKTPPPVKKSGRNDRVQ